MIFCPTLHDIRKNIAFCDVPWLETFVRLVTAVCRYRLVLSVGWIILIEEDQNTRGGGNPFSQGDFSYPKSHMDCPKIEPRVSTVEI